MELIDDGGPSSLIVNIGSIDTSSVDGPKPGPAILGFTDEPTTLTSETVTPPRRSSQGSGSGSSCSSTAAAKSTEQIRVTLVWRNLSVYIPVQKPGLLPRVTRTKEFKQVLNKVTGIVRPGSLVAVMGASGAGKTTLLNVLAHRTLGKLSTEGIVLANGLRVGKFMGNVSGYVYQQDLFYGMLTVSEHLHFMATMKLDRNLNQLDRELRVQKLLTDLSLKKVEHTRIGVPGVINGLSGGERKRLAFAAEILTEPPVLFLDECTTGLDSFSAQTIVGMLQVLAAKGKTILCTIHQPPSQVFAMFDQLCLLADGRTAYMGKALDVLPFLERIGYVCPEQFNPAEFFIKTLAVVPGKENESVMRIHSICDEFVKSKTGLELTDKVRREVKAAKFLELSTSTDEVFGDQYILRKQLRPPTWRTRTRCLIWRAFVDSYRSSKVYLVSRILMRLVSQLVVALCFFRLSMDQKGIQDIQGLIYLMIVENTFPSVYGVLRIFSAQLPIFQRELKAGLYAVSSNYLSTVLAALPEQILQPLVSMTMTYWIVGLRDSFSAYAYTALVIVIISNVSAALGYLFSALFDKVENSSASLLPMEYMLQITAGVFVSLRSLPVWLSWLQYISWFKYGNEMISIVQWHGVENITCPMDYNGPCLTTGDQILASKDFDVRDWLEDFIGLIALYICLHFLAYTALLQRANRK